MTRPAKQQKNKQTVTGTYWLCFAVAVISSPGCVRVHGFTRRVYCIPTTDTLGAGGGAFAGVTAPRERCRVCGLRDRGRLPSGSGPHELWEQRQTR